VYGDNQERVRPIDLKKAETIFLMIEIRGGIYDQIFPLVKRRERESDLNTTQSQQSRA
jgi:hypothetical protein